MGVRVLTMVADRQTGIDDRRRENHAGAAKTVPWGRPFFRREAFVVMWEAPGYQPLSSRRATQICFKTSCCLSFPPLGRGKTSS